MRPSMLPYARHDVDEDDIQAVVDCLRGDWLTTGPTVAEFEEAFAAEVGAKYAVAFNSGTSALHAAMFALDLPAGAEVIVPDVTYIATAYAALYNGLKPVIADVLPDSLLLNEPAAYVSERTGALVTMDYGGQPCDYDWLMRWARRRGLYLIADACHSLGGNYKGRKVGTLADISCFSLHPCKAITTCEGGMATTDNPLFAGVMRLLRNCGRVNTYESICLGWNFRMNDVQAALGLSQLPKLAARVRQRRKLAMRYDFELTNGWIHEGALVWPLAHKNDESAFHLYAITLQGPLRRPGMRDKVKDALRAEGIGAQVHYLPLHMQPYLRKHARLVPPYGDAADYVLTLPLFPMMTEADQDDVIQALRKIVGALQE